MAVSCKELKVIACEAIDDAAENLNSLSQDIWKNPELLFEEHHAHKVLTEFLEKRGFSVERHYVLETAFRAVVDNTDGSGPTAAVICEYDALPGIGHACGHNLIAEVGAGAAVGIKAAIDASRDNGNALGKLLVLGTPAEEGGGGKCHLIKGNGFKDVDFAMMAHPGDRNITLADDTLICRLAGKITFHGKASHAAAFPWEGINALDAAILAYNNISVMRQQMKPTWRINVIISNGGVQPNIIPEETEMLCSVRCPTKGALDVLREKVSRCFETAACATGCKVDVEWMTENVYLNVISNGVLAELYDKNVCALGAQAVQGSGGETEKTPIVASTDMGNVSYEVPSLHPGFYIGTNENVHTRPFTAAAGNQTAQSYTIAEAKALAMTAIDVLCEPDLLVKMKKMFKVDVQKASTSN